MNTTRKTIRTLLATPLLNDLEKAFNETFPPKISEAKEEKQTLMKKWGQIIVNHWTWVESIFGLTILGIILYTAIQFYDPILTDLEFYIALGQSWELYFPGIFHWTFSVSVLSTLMAVVVLFTE